MRPPPAGSSSSTRSGSCKRRRARSSRCAVLPIRRHAFFEQTVLQRELSHDLLQSRGFATQVLDLIRGSRPRRIAGQPLLARLEELLRPAVIEVLDNALAPAQLR